MTTETQPTHDPAARLEAVEEMLDSVKQIHGVVQTIVGLTESLEPDKVEPLNPEAFMWFLRMLNEYLDHIDTGLDIMQEKMARELEAQTSEK